MMICTYIILSYVWFSPRSVCVIYNWVTMICYPVNHVNRIHPLSSFLSPISIWECSDFLNWTARYFSWKMFVVNVARNTRGPRVAEFRWISAGTQNVLTHGSTCPRNKLEKFKRVNESYVSLKLYSLNNNLNLSTQKRISSSK